MLPRLGTMHLTGSCHATPSQRSMPISCTSAHKSWYWRLRSFAVAPLPTCVASPRTCQDLRFLNTCVASHEPRFVSTSARCARAKYRKPGGYERLSLRLSTMGCFGTSSSLYRGRKPEEQRLSTVSGLSLRTQDADKENHTRVIRSPATVGSARCNEMLPSK